MSQVITKREPGLFDLEGRLLELSGKGHGLERLDRQIDWEMFRDLLDRELERQAKESTARPHDDRVLMFKVLVLQRYHNLSDDETEFQAKDRLTFQKFLGLTLADAVPDAKTIWAFRESLGSEAGVEKLFVRFKAHLSEKGLVVRAGSIVDASFVEVARPLRVPRQRNTREENEIVKAGAVPTAFSKDAVRSQKDTDARWAKKGDEVHFGHKNHAKVDRATKLIETYAVTDASVHGSQPVGKFIEEGDGSLHADSAYCGQEIAEKLEEKGIRNEIHERAYRGHPLTEAQKNRNREKSRVRARVEHVFGQMTHGMKDGLKMRWIGMRRITAGVGLLNLVYNMIRYEQIVRLKLA